MSSAANTIPPVTEKASQTGKSASRPNPVALEVPVSVTGARANSGGARDLFNEETTTVLVFKDGAVIRLAAAVSAGQLLFLTNKKSKTEVVCQVLHTKSFRAAMTYVELQFTEERPDYWGVEFPAEKAAVAAPQFQTAEHAEAEATTVRDPETRVAPHKEEDVDRLKKEVEALRVQLVELEKKNAVESAAKAAAEAKAAEMAKAAEEEAIRAAQAAEEAEAAAAAKTESAAPGKSETKTPEVMAKVLGELEQGPKTAQAQLRAILAAKMAEQIAPVNDPVPEATKEEAVKAPAAAEVATETKVGVEAKHVEEAAPASAPSPEAVKADVAAAPQRPAETPLMPEATGKKEPARGVVGMALPMGKVEGSKNAPEPKDAAEEMLPKPSLDFSKMPGGQTIAAAQMRGRPGFDLRQLKAPALSALVVLFGCMVWYGKMWTYVGIGTGSKTLKVAAKVVGKPAAAKTPAAAGTAAGSAVANATAKSDATNGTVPSAETSAIGDTAAENATPESNEASAPSVEEHSAKKNAKGRNKTADAGAAVGSKPGELASTDAPVLPAKLVKAANPVYPPDAMRSFITGDVKAEVVVEPDGHVGEVKVLSGPKPFQQAAVEALRQYKYAPATQGGKAVASKVTEVVKFWFNP